MDAKLTAVKRAATRRDKSEDVWRTAIRDAVGAGLSLRAVAKAAGVSHVRVLQIVRGD